MLAGERVHERLYETARREIEDETEGDADGKRGKRLLEHGEQKKREAKADQNGDETGQRSVPIPVRRRLPHQHATKGKDRSQGRIYDSMSRGQVGRSKHTVEIAFGQNSSSAPVENEVSESQLDSLLLFFLGFIGADLDDANRSAICER